MTPTAAASQPALLRTPGGIHWIGSACSLVAREARYTHLKNKSTIAFFLVTYLSCPKADKKAQTKKLQSCAPHSISTDSGCLTPAFLFKSFQKQRWGRGSRVKEQPYGPTDGLPWVPRNPCAVWRGGEVQSTRAMAATSLAFSLASSCAACWG